jgi:hypothetical protein
LLVRHNSINVQATRVMFVRNRDCAFQTNDIAHVMLCTGVGDCEVVQQSSHAEVVGIPVALLGLLGYLAILGCLFIQERRGSFARVAPYLMFGRNRQSPPGVRCSLVGTFAKGGDSSSRLYLL